MVNSEDITKLVQLAEVISLRHGHVSNIWLASLCGSNRCALVWASIFLVG